MNYIGSKYSLIDFIQDIIYETTKIDKYDNVIFADLFAGTGVVGSTYKEKGCYVISNDIQHYSYVINKHFIGNSNSFDNDLIGYLNSLEGIEGFVYNNYCEGSGCGRNYFSNENGMKCDAIRLELQRMYCTKEIDDRTFFFLLGSLINSIDKYANTASVYGAFLKKIKTSASREFVLEPLPIINGIEGKVYNENVSDLINNISGDILYLDPPYNSRQYCDNYHVLETISKYDNPILKGKTGLRNSEKMKSDFCIKKCAKSALDNLIRRANFKYIYLSYNDEGVIKLEDIKDIMSSYGEYNIYSIQYKRFKSNNIFVEKPYTIEYLHFLEKK